MELQPLAYMLEDLLHEASDDGVEVCLAETPFANTSEADALRVEYELRYRRAVQCVGELRGDPTFAGGQEEPGRPTWHHAEHLTCWSDTAGVIFVGLASENGVLRVIGGARPHPVEREAITLLPPA